MNKIKHLFGALVLGVVFALGAVEAVQASVDSWSQHTEALTPFSQSVTAGTPALVVTAVSTKNPNVRAMVLTSSVSTTVIFHNANSTGGGSIIGVYGLLANTPLPLSEDLLGQGMKGGLGNPIYVDVGSTATVSITGRVRSDPN